jgi:hypothetical protein
MVRGYMSIQLTAEAPNWVGLLERIVLPMEIAVMDTEDEYKKHGTLRLLRYIYSNPFRFPISSLGLPNIPSQES